MKKTILTLLVLVLACQLTAQYRNDNKHNEAVAIGIRAGGNLASYAYTDNDDLNALGYDPILSRVRPMLGLNVEIPLFNGIVYVAPEVSFTGRGDSRLFESASYDTLVRYRARVNYLEARLPISIAIPVSQNFKPYVFAAPSFGVVMDTVGPLTSEIKQYSLDNSLNDSVAVNSSNMFPYDYGVTVGAGMRFRFNFSSFSMILKVEGGYHLGLHDTYSEQEHLDQAQALNVNAYNVNGKRLNRGIEAAVTIAIPLDFHSSDDCFYWSDVNKRKNKNRGLYGF